MKEVALILLVLRVHSSEEASGGFENIGDAVMKDARAIRNPRAFKGRELGIMGQQTDGKKGCVSKKKEKKEREKEIEDEKRIERQIVADCLNSSIFSHTSSCLLQHAIMIR